MTSFPTILGNAGQYDGVILGSGGPASYTANRYSAVGLGQSAMVVPAAENPLSSGFTNEISTRQKIHVAGTVSDLRWGLDLAFGATLTFTLRQNAANASLAVSFGPTDTGWKSDTTHSVSVASGDYLDFEADVGTGNTSYAGDFNCASASFTATTDSAQLIASVGPYPMNAIPGLVRYADFLGILVLAGVESKAQFSARASGIWEYLACHIASNSFDAATSIVNRIGSGGVSIDGSMAIVVPSGSLSGPNMGNFEDVTHSDSVSVNDLLDYAFVSSADAGDTLVIDWVGCHFFAANAHHCMIGGMPGFTPTMPYNTTTYTSLFGGGDVQPFAHNVPRATGTFPYDATVKQFSNYITAGEGTCTLMINGAASALAVTASTGNTGWLTDTSDTATVSAGDTCANRISGSGVSGTKITYQGAGLLVAAL
jgi:hypothetical protein